MLRPAMREREPAPKDEYRRRESLHQARAANSRRFEERISRARLGVALTAALVAWLAFGAAVPSPWSLAAPALTPRLDLREDLAVLGEEVAATARPDALASLATSAASPPGMRLRLGAAAIGAATLAAVVSWALGWAPSSVALGALAIQSLIRSRLGRHVLEADRAVAGHGPDLDLLAAVFG